jgi:prophage regulatory protein
VKRVERAEEVQVSAQPLGPAAGERLLPEKVVRDRTSLDRVTRWRLVRAGKFPAPVRISPGRVAWAESAINGWIAAKIAGGAAQ